MKSLHPMDPDRITVSRSHIITEPDGQRIRINVEFLYDPWEPTAAQDSLWEQANALQLISNIIEFGSLPLHYPDCGANADNHWSEGPSRRSCDCRQIHRDLQQRAADDQYDSWKNYD